MINSIEIIKDAIYGGINYEYPDNFKDLIKQIYNWDKNEEKEKEFIKKYLESKAIINNCRKAINKSLYTDKDSFNYKTLIKERIQKIENNIRILSIKDISKEEA